MLQKQCRNYRTWAHCAHTDHLTPHAKFDHKMIITQAGLNTLFGPLLPLFGPLLPLFGPLLHWYIENTHHIITSLVICNPHNV